jgi:hypothetical protein
MKLLWLVAKNHLKKQEFSESDLHLSMDHTQSDTLTTIEQKYFYKGLASERVKRINVEEKKVGAK